MNILIILISVLLNSIAQILIRKGMLTIGQIYMNNLIESIVPIVTNVWLISALLCYVISFATWMVALSKFEVSFAYPLLSIGYVLTAVAGYFFLGENISLMKFIGILIICIGIGVLSRG